MVSEGMRRLGNQLDMSPGTALPFHFSPSVVSDRLGESDMASFVAAFRGVEV
jgi:hypothetical protein